MHLFLRVLIYVIMIKLYRLRSQIDKKKISSKLAIQFFLETAIQVPPEISSKQVGPPEYRDTPTFFSK